MRFITRHPRYSFHAQASTQQIVMTQNGPMQVAAQPMILCQFEQGGLSPWEIELALKSFHFAGQPDENMVPKENRLAVYDTELAQLQQGWNDDTRSFVEQRLLADAEYGKDYIAVGGPKREAPWPAYDRVPDAATLLQMIPLLGFDTYEGVEKIRLYEHDHQHRPEILEALEALQAQFVPSGEPVDDAPAEVIHA